MNEYRKKLNEKSIAEKVQSITFLLKIIKCAEKIIHIFDTFKMI